MFSKIDKNFSEKSKKMLSYKGKFPIKVWYDESMKKAIIVSVPMPIFPPEFLKKREGEFAPFKFRLARHRKYILSDCSSSKSMIKCLRYDKLSCFVPNAFARRMPLPAKTFPMEHEPSNGRRNKK